MSKVLRTHEGGNYLIKPLTIGGTEADTAPVALDNLNGIPFSELGTENGVVGLDENGRLAIETIPAINSGYLPTIDGPLEVLAGSSIEFDITNFDDYTTYIVSGVNGTAVRVNDKITYTAVNNYLGGQGGFNINGKAVIVTILPTAQPLKPSITAPLDNATGINVSTLNIISSPYAVTTGNATHVGSDWQVATDLAFTQLFTNLVNSNQLTTITLNGLTLNTAYYARVRYKDSAGTIQNGL